VPHAGPAFPAACTVRIPAARTLSTTARSTSGSVQPSAGVQVQELLTTSGARDGSGELPSIFVGAMNHW
jgi:hypothetical protein